MKERVRRRGRRIASCVGRVLRIAKWEVSKSAGTIDRKTVVAVLLLTALVGFAGVSVMDDGIGLDDELYTVAVDEDSPYFDVAERSPEFRTVEPGSDADVIVDESNTVRPGRPSDSHTLEPAYEDFVGAIETHNAGIMAQEPDESAAFPVLVDLEYQQRSVGGDSSSEPGGELDSLEDIDDAEGAEIDEGAHDGEGSEDTAGTDDGFESESGTQEDTYPDGDIDDEETLQVPDVGSGDLGEATGPSTPGDITPPFPFQSLVLAFLFLVPMNFVIQAYGSTIMDERINRRGELLLVSPASPREIVAGKSLPYFLGLVGIVVGTAWVIGGSALSVAATIPIAMAFLAATFAGAMFARSFKELTFVTVTISVFLTTYTFVPAIFSDVTPIALISPLTIVVMDLQTETVSVVEYLFSTGPFYVGSVVLVLLGIGLYREEDMFAQKPIPAKFVDAIGSRIHGYRSIPLFSILFIPFVFAGQLLTVAVLFALPPELSLPLVIVVAAAIEEFAKSIHVYAGFATSRFDASIRIGVLLGGLSGAGFFLGEKITHVVQLVGIPDLELGEAVFGPALALEPTLLFAALVAPLLLHVLTASISSIGASRGRTMYAVGFVIATLVHAVYNMGVLVLVA